MKALSYWASRHIWQARLIIILIGIFRGTVGVLFGFMFLKNMHAMEMNVAACVLFSLIFGIEALFHRRKLTLLDAPDKLYTFRVRCLSILYTCNFLLFMLVGNAVYRFEPTEEKATVTSLYSIVSYKNDPSVILDKKGVTLRKRLFSFEKMRAKWQQKLSSDEDSFSELELTIVGFLLLLLFFPLFGLACSTACGGNEILAVIILFGAIGSLIGGFYFLTKAARISNKRRAIQQQNEKLLKSKNMKTHTPIPHTPIVKPVKTPEEKAEAKAQKKRVLIILFGLAIALVLGLLMFL